MNKTELINICELFIDTHNEIYNKYKSYKNKKIKKYDIQKRYMTLLYFVSTSCFWTRYNRDPYTNKYIEAEISGKYLNEIHNELVTYNFYEILYKKLLDIYLKLTNYETLKTVSQDSMFAINIMAFDR